MENDLLKYAYVDVDEETRKCLFPDRNDQHLAGYLMDHNWPEKTGVFSLGEGEMGHPMLNMLSSHGNRETVMPSQTINGKLTRIDDIVPLSGNAVLTSLSAKTRSVYSTRMPEKTVNGRLMRIDNVVQ